MQEIIAMPAIRFDGFTDDWKLRRLGECFSERVESMPGGELISVTINGGIKKFSELGRHDSSNEDKSKYKKVCVGDIAYNSMRMWQGASGCSPYEGIVSPAYTVLVPHPGIAPKCFAYQFKTSKAVHVFQINSQGITSDNWNLKYPTLSEIGLLVSPDIKEQEKIAKLFACIDSLITIQQSKYLQLSNFKQAMLEKMFPRDGADTPEIRFNGFTEDWEKCKLEEVANRFDNLRIPVAANLRVPGTTPYYGANGIQDYVDGFTHEGEFILVAEDGANDLKNYPVKYVNGRIWVNNHAHVLRGKPGIADSKFIAYLISRSNIETILVGGGRAKLNAEVMMGLELYIPSLAEQKVIGRYLTTLDNLITLQQSKLERLKNIKKAFLEKMFV